MNRYDQVAGKKSSPKKSKENNVAEEIQQYRDRYGGDAEQTTKKGKNLAIRGPNGFQIMIPINHVRIRELTGENGQSELCISIPPSMIRELRADIKSVTIPDSQAYSDRGGLLESMYRTVL